MPRRPLRTSSALLLLALAALPCLRPDAARAQSGVSPEAAPAAPEATSPQLNPTGPQTEITPVNPPPASAPVVTAPDGTPSAPDATPAAPVPSRLKAPSVIAQGTVFFATGTPEMPVRFESAAGLIVAQQVRLDTRTQQLTAKGQVQFEREREVTRKDLRARRLPSTSRVETVRETAFGNDLTYDFSTGEGTLDNAKLRLATLSISSESLQINGENYVARNVVLRPGGLTDEEIKIYGTPPFNLRAREISAAPVERNGETRQRVTLRGGALYFKSTRILPVPTYSFFPGGGRNNGDSRLTPGLSFNSADRLLVTTSFDFPLDKAQPERLNAVADVGFSARVGFRGGLGLNSTQKAGRFALDLRKNDVVSTQLTNRIVLDRLPELTYRSPAFAQFNLGRQRAGLAFDASVGDFTERTIGGSNSSLSSTRARARLVLTTRLQPGPGAFARLFSVYSSYGEGGTYRNNGLQIGYDGALLPRVRGQISLRLTDVKGDTPFRFDRVEIRRELRATVDYQLSPRYIIPIDLRYDLQQSRFRDETFGILRSYKTFAYGLTYQTARRDLRLEIREGF